MKFAVYLLFPAALKVTRAASRIGICRAAIGPSRALARLETTLPSVLPSDACSEVWMEAPMDTVEFEALPTPIMRKPVLWIDDADRPVRVAAACVALTAWLTRSTAEESPVDGL